MYGTDKVIWREGLFLQTQHFQLAERRLNAAVHERFSAANPHLFGLTRYTIDTDALENGSIALVRAHGVMPDGTPLGIGVQDPLPSPRAVQEHFPHDRPYLDVYLALPYITEGRPSVADAEDTRGASRFRGTVASITDEVTGRNEKDIEIGKLNFRLLFDDESRDAFTTMRIARITRAPDGRFVLDETCVPPLLYINASPRLMEMLRSMLELLLARIGSLEKGRRQVEGGFAEFGDGSQTSFGLLHTLNTFTPLLNHGHFAGTVHPLEIFRILTQCTGALCTFSADVSVKMLPRYEHTDLHRTMAGFETLIRRILGAGVSARCVNIPIREIGPATYLCEVPDQSLFAKAKFYLGLAADIPQKELVVGALTRIKMCSREQLELLIPSAMPGLPLVNIPEPPKELSSKPGYIYFALSSDNQFWDGIRTSGNIAFYFPNDFAGLQMEMTAVRR